MMIREGKEMNNKKQDIRIIKLAKWQIPKTKSVLGYDGASTYLSIGYLLVM